LRVSRYLHRTPKHPSFLSKAPPYDPIHLSHCTERTPNKNIDVDNLLQHKFPPCDAAHHLLYCTQRISITHHVYRRSPRTGRSRRVQRDHQSSQCIQGSRITKRLNRQTSSAYTRSLWFNHPDSSGRFGFAFAKPSWPPKFHHRAKE
jgi:hypothetical protein